MLNLIKQGLAKAEQRLLHYLLSAKQQLKPYMFMALNLHPPSKDKLQHIMTTFSCKPNAKQKETPCKLRREKQDNMVDTKKTSMLKREKGKQK